MTSPNKYLDLYHYWFDRLNIFADSMDPAQFRRVLESMWKSQLDSKHEAIRLIAKNILSLDCYTYQFHGGWFGIGAMLLEASLDHEVNIVTVDVDPVCEAIGHLLRPELSCVIFETANMLDVRDPAETALVTINTSSEHLTQNEYMDWLALRIPDSYVLVQGNNMRHIPDHVRCHDNLSEFVEASIGLNTYIDSSQILVPGGVRYSLLMRVS